MKKKSLIIIALIFFSSIVSAQTEPINKTNLIYSILLPIFAFILTIYSFRLSSSKVKHSERNMSDGLDQVQGNTREKTTRLLTPILPFIATWLWYQSSYTTINIQVIDNFTATASPYYVAAGNQEIGTMFAGFAVIMFLVTIYTIFDSLIQTQYIHTGGTT